MDASFSACDGLRAMTCCFPTCRLVNSEGGLRNQGVVESDRRWYDTPTSSSSTPRSSVPPTGRAVEPFERGRMSRNDFLVRDWEDEEERDSRREADLLSLHDQNEFNTRGRNHDAGDTDDTDDVSGSRSGSRTTRTRRGVGGDISGSGISWGSGLSRWTLLKSWWRGSGPGRIRLPDDEDEDENGRFEAMGGLLAPSRAGEEGNTTLMEGEGDGDAFEIREEIVDPPIDAPLSPTKSTATNLSDERGRYNDETPEERDARRERRRARRRARELGLSVQDFDQGVVADPDELLSPAVRVDLEPTDERTPRSGRQRHYQSSSHSSSADSYLPDYPAQLSSGHRGQDASALSVVGEHGDDSYRDDHDEAERQARKEVRRQRRAARAEAAAATEGNGGAYYYEGRAPASSNGSNSSRSHSHPAASPRLASTYLAAPINLHPPETKRSRHRSNPSTSTTSTTSSSGQRPRPRKQQHLMRSPLEEEEAFLPVADGGQQYDLAEDGNYYLAAPQPVYVQDEHGQLRAVLSQENLAYDAHSVGVEEAGELSSTAYDHVGVIPGKVIEEEGDGDGTDLEV
ncbi:BZ3500_MvSof-1268-A1-R1_Chr9g10539 [Microbotryum saponariae]|uniref:BZ3500_MvSof-1268-A1-R1_Chr9g10539 protein n=1 Tax=Microbotryum saponariae TaxID=289078 RepID=A0A2X0KBF7_9BASI|nr:BZ3501_MvSof-1269-A2-R1_Chr9g10288 [Microbotryum saponariae]SDA00262.1 BZ3500_MvSof-1268-A1-R1_Chr9g10539 [Microbotryum saponariae]